MADFNTPFASTAARRTPNADEKANGFPCGAADQSLFNGMFHRIEAELGNLISYAGLIGTDTDYSQVRKSIVALIDAATGGGETENYLLITQAAARLPIFPEVASADGKILLTTPVNGTIRVPGGVNIIHRGIAQYTTAQQDFNTLASRIYHLRWNPTTGFSLQLLTDPAYNPDGYAESHQALDTKYDDMLVARVVTNAGNVATITPLANKNKLRLKVDPIAAVPYKPLGGFYWAADYNIVTDWARTPDIVALRSWLGATGSPDVTGAVLHGHANVLLEETTTRYNTFHKVTSDWNNELTGLFSACRGYLGA